jgi:hypothetical protein
VISRCWSTARKNTVHTSLKCRLPRNFRKLGYQVLHRKQSYKVNEEIIGIKLDTHKPKALILFYHPTYVALRVFIRHLIHETEMALPTMSASARAVRQRRKNITTEFGSAEIWEYRRSLVFTVFTFLRFRGHEYFKDKHSKDYSN